MLQAENSLGLRFAYYVNELALINSQTRARARANHRLCAAFVRVCVAVGCIWLKSTRHTTHQVHSWPQSQMTSYRSSYAHTQTQVPMCVPVKSTNDSATSLPRKCAPRMNAPWIHRNAYDARVSRCHHFLDVAIRRTERDIIYLQNQSACDNTQTQT